MAPPHQTASGTVTESPLVLIDVVTDQNVVGHSIVFTYTTAVLKPTAELVQNLAPLIEREALAPAAIEQKLARRFRLLGTQGLVGMALAGIDMALWDALARVHNISLVSLLGGSARPVPAYGAVGYDGETESAKVAEDWVRRGFTGIKAKVGYSTVAQDLAVIRAIRSAVGRDAAIMVDYNQTLTPAEAVERLRQVEEEGLTWIEEPTLAHDYRGHAHIAAEIRTDSVRRKLVGRARHATRHRGGRQRLYDARRDEDWGCNGLDAGSRVGRGSRHSPFEPSVAGD